MKFEYSNEPEDGRTHTAQYDLFYTRFAPLYDWLVKSLPVWRNWIGSALPHIRGPRVLEISFGTGYLLTQYAGQFETYGVDYNQRLASMAKGNLHRAGLKAGLQVADVTALPYCTAAPWRQDRDGRYRFPTRREQTRHFPDQCLESWWGYHSRHASTV